MCIAFHRQRLEDNFDHADYARLQSLLQVVRAAIANIAIATPIFNISQNMKPAAATIVTLSVFFFDTIFRNIPYFESLQPYFLTTHMSTWLHVMETYVPWWRIAEDFSYLFAADTTFVILALAAFHERDFKA